ncbi:MAG TPA: sporulation protein YabP [Firmicutes bacterium]|uniref:Sporulation protein YabP n=1 Tax=Candidatus Fermentithermobacillus carboniphilus TaxID=3085328 RepID=A0AAT9LHE7_9FIRM|nr:MAG: sporulation protein YabP [Candidatus Fermentithermobacillus carboniphilus]HHW17404.1 sporulation protein YabP [Candidatus Fermentithermobacillaceae bacterium]
MDEKGHKVEIFQREQVRLHGVIHVESFDDRQVVIETEMGILALTGEDFHITSLDLEKGQMLIEGMVVALEYSGLDKSKSRQKERGFFQRLFR